MRYVHLVLVTVYAVLDARWGRKLLLFLTLFDEYFQNIYLHLLSAHFMMSNNVFNTSSCFYESIGQPRFRCATFYTVYPSDRYVTLRRGAFGILLSF